MGKWLSRADESHSPRDRVLERSPHQAGHAGDTFCDRTLTFIRTLETCQSIPEGKNPLFVFTFRTTPQACSFHPEISVSMSRSGSEPERAVELNRCAVDEMTPLGRRHVGQDLRAESLVAGLLQTIPEFRPLRG